MLFDILVLAVSVKVIVSTTIFSLILKNKFLYYSLQFYFNSEFGSSKNYSSIVGECSRFL